MTTTTYTDYTVTDAADKDFLYNNLFLEADHLHVYKRALGSETYIETTDFALAGASGAMGATLTGAAATALGVGDIVRVRRITPVTPLVTFMPGSLRASDLNLVTLQNLYRTEEGVEIPNYQVVTVDTAGLTVLTLSGDAFDAGGNRIEDVSDAVNPEDVVNLGQMSTAIAAIPAGDTLPGAVTADDMLYVAAGEWVVGGPSVIRGKLGLGTAALLAAGVATSADLLRRSDGDARYPQRANALSELITDGLQAAARSNLGLTSAAVTAMGTGASQIVQLDGSGKLPAVDGSQVDLSAHTLLNGNAGHFQFEGNTYQGGDRATGVDKLLGKGGARMKFSTASGAAVTVNGGPTVNAVSADKSWTLEFSGAATETYEVTVYAAFENDGTGSGAWDVEARTSPTMDGTGVWSSLPFPRGVFVVPATSADLIVWQTSFTITGPQLLEFYTYNTSLTNGIKTHQYSPSMVSVRRLNS